MIHIFLHFLVPLFLARRFYRDNWLKVYALLCMTMLVDLDHLLADPIYDPDRCSINFHPLHSYWMIGLYCFFLFPRKTRVIALGLIIHMALDWQECIFPLKY